MGQILKANSIIFPVTKIKNFIRTNQKIGKISSTAPAMIGKVMELIMIDLLNEATVIMEREKSIKIKNKHIKLAATKNRRFKRFSFLF
nr:hypothetical protein 1634Bnrm2_p101 [Cryptomonas sp.]